MSVRKNLVASALVELRFSEGREIARALVGMAVDRMAEPAGFKVSSERDWHKLLMDWAESHLDVEVGPEGE